MDGKCFGVEIGSVRKIFGENMEIPLMSDRGWEILEKLEAYHVAQCCYGHLHGYTHRRAIQGRYGTVDYSLISADYLRFVPKKIFD